MTAGTATPEHGQGKGTGWVMPVSPSRSPEPPPTNHDHAPRFHQLQTTWRHYIGPTPNQGGDYEDWVEEACRLQAAIDVLGPHRLWLERKTPQATIRNAATGDPHPNPNALPRWGGQPVRDNTGYPITITGERAADRYATTHAFRRHAGRRIHLANTETLPDAILAATREGTGDVWAKVTTKAKYGIYRIPRPTDPNKPYGNMDPDEREALFGALAHLEGRPDAFLVYPHVTMNYEYRVFLVDGVPVTGAGCIEDRTPLDNTGDPFDPWVAQHRNRTAAEYRPDIRDQFIDFARQIGPEFAGEGVGAVDIDVAMGDDGPLVIECNGILNAGLYASRPELVLHAVDASPTARDAFMRVPFRPLAE